MRNHRKFLVSETGATTIDFVVMTAGIVGLGMAVAASVTGGVNNGALSIRAALQTDGVEGGGLAPPGPGEPGFIYSSNWGVLASEIEGWTFEGSDTIGFMNSEFAFSDRPDGYALRLREGGNNITISQEMKRAVTGVPYTISLEARSLPLRGNGLQVRWGGEVVGEFNTSAGDFPTYTFDVVGGSGAGGNMLSIAEIGDENLSHGTYVDNVQFYRTPGT